VKGAQTIILRNVATKMAAKTVNWLIEQLTHVAARDGKSSVLRIHFILIRIRSEKKWIRIQEMNTNFFEIDQVDYVLLDPHFLADPNPKNSL